MKAQRTSVRSILCGGLCGIAATAMAIGCSRYDHVREADDQVYRLVAEKSNDPRWEQLDFSVDLDPRSRYFDPFDDVSPPMPPDDPASAELMKRIDGKRHWKYWDQFGQRFELENPSWRDDLAEYVEMTEDGKIHLGLEEAVRLAMIHKPDFQEQFETVYLSALDVSTERFRFDTQFFGSFTGDHTTTGPETPNIVFNPRGTGQNPPNANSRMSLDSSLTAQRQLATAGQLLVGFANSMVWEFTGRNSEISTSLLNFSLIQPLLRAGGRAFALEQLTIVERVLLGNLRALERFRQGFYTDIAIGNQGVSGPSRRGGFFGAGLAGFTGIGSGGFGNVGSGTFGRGFGGAGGGGGGGGAGGGFAGGGQGEVGGFLGLLQQAQQIRNSEQNLAAQISQLELLELYQENGEINFAQVAQFRQNIESERSNLLQNRNRFQNTLEGFLTGTLGLPPDLPVELNEEFIRPLRFTDEDVRNLQNAITELRGSFEQETSEAILREKMNQTAELLKQVESLVERVAGDIGASEEPSDRRRQQLAPADREVYDRNRGYMLQTYENAKVELKNQEQAIANLRNQLNAENLEATEESLASSISKIRTIVDDLSYAQIQARLEVVDIQKISLEPQRALEIARANRLDWMNNRAALVDTWRLIQFNANRLKSDVTLRLDGDISTIRGDNPFKFRDESGSVRASLQIDPPFTRLTERNNFRQQLIEYQQARRQLIQFEDGVYLSLRQSLRALEQTALNLEIQRKAVVISIRRAIETRDKLEEPLPPPVPGQVGGGQGRGETVATNVLNALADLRNTQNNFMSAYLNYYATRMALMRDLGLMRIDENGMWIDESLDLALAAAQQYNDCELPPEIPSDWLAPESAVPMTPGEEMPELPANPPAPMPADENKPQASAARLPACRPRR